MNERWVSISVVAVVDGISGITTPKPFFGAYLEISHNSKHSIRNTTEIKNPSKEWMQTRVVVMSCIARCYFYQDVWLTLPLSLISSEKTHVHFDENVDAVLFSMFDQYNRKSMRLCIKITLPLEEKIFTRWSYFRLVKEKCWMKSATQATRETSSHRKP